MNSIWKLAFLFILAGIFVSCAGEDSQSSSHMINIGSHSLQIQIEGKGSPVIVLDAGLGDQMDKLRPLQERLAKKTKVFIYNRAGYGRSEAGPLPRDCGREAAELKKLLGKASVPGPYLLVGHSLGALNMQMFAHKYPNEVIGIVLLDPPPLSFILGKDYIELREMADKMTAEWQKMADSLANSRDEKENIQSVFFRMIASEHREMFGETARLVDGISTFGDLPLVVIGAGKANPGFGEMAEAYQKYWIAQSRALVGKSSKGRFIIAEKSSHYIYLDAFDLTIETIIELSK